MITKKIIEFLEKREFISVATCDFDGHPNAAPKFLLKVENNFIYLVDYTLSKTWENLKINPKVSLSFVDTNSLSGFQVNGPVEILYKGSQYDKIVHELSERIVSLSAKRIIEGLYRGQKHENFEIGIPEKCAIFKIKIEEVTEIGPKGDLKKERL
ncbi:MAG: pyridoxamine 5'-phosphate oxidase family protein [Candidatus Omnitrophota bacterium]|jgi:predicted pyridoxine 5'-phosphate oxidase superfamily flavin-nucleotide-binding protein